MIWSVCERERERERERDRERDPNWGKHTNLVFTPPQSPITNGGP